MRLSSKRQSTHPPMSDEDVLASSSAGWKAVALPEPAKMVSLPEVEDLPSKREVAKAAKAAKKAAKDEPAPRIAEGTTPSERVDPAATPAPAPLPTPKPAPASRLAKQPAKAGRGRTLAIGGILLAAAAGIAIFVGTNHKVATQAAPATATTPATPPAAPVQVKAEAAPAAPPPAAPTPPPAEAAPAPETTTAAIAAPVAPASPAPARAERHEKHVEAARGHAEVADKNAATRPAATSGGGGSANANDGEPKESFQQLLKEAGVDDTKKVAKPVLSRKMLSADDFKSGMDGVASAAQGCYKGTQGLASIKLVIAPSGKVSSVSVTGMFAGKPEGACVEHAVRAATFPPWDGGPQTFRYSYLLAE